MPKKINEKTIDKLVGYIKFKDDRLKKFRACVKKHNVDLTEVKLPKGRSLLHCASKYACGAFINYLLRHGVPSCKTDKKGNLPIHVALDRALQLTPQEASEVYTTVVIPLLKDYPDAFYLRDHHGNTVGQLLSTLNRYMLLAFDSESSSSDSSSQFSSCSSSESSHEEDFVHRLFGELDSESAEFYGRYNFDEDCEHENQKETYNEWAERMGREMHGRHSNSHYGRAASSNSRKRKHQTSEQSSSRPKVRKERFAGINPKEEIHKAKVAESAERARATYEERFKIALEESSEKKMTYSDVPWPSKGSIEHVMEVLFGDKGGWSTSALKKYVREQQVRWHPDKFLQKFIDKIAPKSFERVMDRVKEISQALNKKAESLSSG